MTMETGIKSELQKIVELQKTDSRLFELRREKDTALPASLKQFQDSLKQKQEEFKAQEEAYKKVQLKKKDYELELASKEEASRKAQGQLYQLKTNKEYQAKLTEIASIKADISRAEEEVLKAMDAIETAKAELEKHREELKKEEAKYNAEAAQIQNKIKDYEAEIANISQKRERFAKEISPKVFSHYERLLKSRDGLAVVPVVGTSCGACYMRISHQTINLIKMYSELVMCGNCVRILYIPEDLAE